MAGWEIVVLVGGAVTGFILGKYFERQFHDRVLRLVGDSWVRALGLLVAVLLAGLLLAVVLIQSLPGWYQAAPMVTLVGTAVYFAGVFLVIMPFFPSTVHSVDGGSSRRGLREAGGSGAVSIILGWGGVLVSLTLFSFAVLGPALVLIDP